MQGGLGKENHTGVSIESVPDLKYGQMKVHHWKIKNNEMFYTTPLDIQYSKNYSKSNEVV